MSLLPACAVWGHRFAAAVAAWRQELLARAAAGVTRILTSVDFPPQCRLGAQRVHLTDRRGDRKAAEVGDDVDLSRVAWHGFGEAPSTVGDRVIIGAEGQVSVRQDP